MHSLTIIAAVADNGVIGHGDGRLPWSLPADLARFKRLTLGHTLIMGRRTFEAIGRPLPGRRTIVVTRHATWSAAGAETAASLEDAVARAGDGEVFVAGGGEIYQLAMPSAVRLLITHVHLEAEGEVVFPQVAWNEWRETWREAHPVESDAPAFTFVDYARR